MRTREEVLADLAALDRPRFPYPPTPAALERFWCAVAMFRAAKPNGDERYEALLAELNALDAPAPKRPGSTLEALGVPERTARAAENPRNEEPVRVVTLWGQGSLPWCLLLGATGAGKSVAAAVGLKAAYECGHSCMWLPSSELTHRAGGFDGQQFADRVKHVEVLVLDDVGVEHQSDFARSVFSEILLHRHEDGGRTIITSNLDKKGVAARLGPRLTDRMRGANVSREFNGPSLRGVG